MTRLNADPCALWTLIAQPWVRAYFLAAHWRGKLRRSKRKSNSKNDLLHGFHIDA